MGGYRLIALDLDGTLLTEEKTITAETKRWIRRATEAGIAVCFATGRAFQSALPYAEELGLSTPMVTVNGSEVWEAPHRLLQRTLLPHEPVLALRELALTYDTWYWAYSVEGVYNKDHWTDRPETTEWMKFGFYTEDEKALAAVRAGVDAIGGLEVTNSHPMNLECNPAGIHKAAGLEGVCRLLGIRMDEVVAVGDSMNDLSMIRAAGLGVAMGNAQELVKHAADFVTDANDEDGVARVIRERVLEQRS